MPDIGRRDRQARTAQYALAAAVVGLTTAVCLLFRSRLNPVDVAMVLLLPVVIAAARYRQGPSILAAGLATAAFDFFFVPPYYTFNVDDTSYIFTFGVMLVVALIMGRLTAQIAAQALEAQERERHVTALYAMNRALAGVESAQDLVALAGRHIGHVVGGEATVFLTDDGARGEAKPVWPTTGVFRSIEVRVAAAWAHEHGEPAGWGTVHAAQAEALVVPIKIPTRALGVVAIAPDSPDQTLTEANLATAQALAEMVAVPLARTPAER